MEYSLREKLEVAKELVSTFKPERYLFFIISTISVLALLVISIYSFMKGAIDSKTFFALFAPAGGISISAGLILRMFSNCLEFLKDELK
jgi:hypothetical protein